MAAGGSRLEVELRGRVGKPCPEFGGAKVEIDENDKVKDILKKKKGSIKNAPLDEGSPSWDDILEETWGSILDKAAKGVKGYRTIKKLLGKGEYDK